MGGTAEKRKSPLRGAGWPPFRDELFSVPYDEFKKNLQKFAVVAGRIAGRFWA
jgi:hypothetical protein